MTLEQEAFLLRQRVARLATETHVGEPRVLPVCFALVEGRIYTPIDEKPKRRDPAQLRRLREIAANPAVCLVVDEYGED